MKTKLLTYSGLSILLVCLTSIGVQAQNERKFVRQGNKIYENALADTTRLDTLSFSLAETAYRRALDKRPDDLKWNFNLGDALYKQMKFEESTGKFNEIAEKSTDKTEKSRAYHNTGNSLLMQNKLDESIAAYKNALRNNPNDLETKYNLLYAMNLKKRQDEQKQKQDQNKDQQDKDKNKDKDKDKEKDQNKDNQDQNQDKKQDQQNQQPQEQKISKENAERLLQALQNDEEKIQEKVKKTQAEKARQRQTDKDW